MALLAWITYFAAALTVWLALLLHPVARRYAVLLALAGLLWPLTAIALMSYLITEPRIANRNFDLPPRR